MKENVIEWLDGEETISVTLYQKRFINKIKRMALSDSRVVILAENNDGSIFAHLPIETLKLSPKRNVELTDERKQKGAEALRKWREQNEL